VRRPVKDVHCLFLIAVLSGTLSCAHGNRAQIPSSAKSQLETHATPLGLVDLTGDAFDLWQTGGGRLTVVLFTRTDCPISNRYAPEIRRLHEMYSPRGVEFYLIYVDPDEQPAAIRQHLKDYQYPCQALRDPNHTLVEYCHATVTPEAVVFDKDRAIVYRGRVCDQYVELGNARAGVVVHDLENAIEATVQGRSVAKAQTPAVGCRIADLKY
jgi:cytochrome oxidase Cu insertion factor (SCO1/SenC/PrrC family)